MKKLGKVLALFIAVLMVASIQLPAMAVEFGDEVTENIPSLTNLTKNNCTALGTSSQTLNSSQFMAENDKYIFVAIGMKGLNFRVCSAVQVFDKATGNLLTTITQATGNTTWYAPVRGMHVHGNMLYVQWGNALNNAAAAPQRPKVDGATKDSPLLAYNVANVTAGSTLTGTLVCAKNAFAAADLPYAAGAISYLDEETGTLYSSWVPASAASKKMRYYFIYDAATIASGTVPTEKVFFTYGDEAMNTTQFIFKDNWLFEVIQNKAGVVDYATSTLTTNSQVRVYNLAGLTPSETTQQITNANHLKGIYTTATADGDKNVAIKDIEIVGDYMYVATLSGVEVVSLAPAKAADASAETVLTAAKTVTVADMGHVADLESVDGLLYAAYVGPQYYNGPSTSEDGKVVVYDIATNPADPATVVEKAVEYGALQMSLNEKDGKIYLLNDTMGTANISAYGYTPGDPSFTSVKLGDNEVVSAGAFDIKVELDNPDRETGTLICAVYEGNKLADVFVKANHSANGVVTMAEGYEVGAAVTEVKAMFLNSLTGELKPLIPAISIGQ